MGTRDRIKWSSDRNSYIFKSNGRSLSDRRLYAVVAEEISLTETKFDRLAKQLTDRKIPFFEWQFQMSELIRKNHVDMLRFGRGGKNEVTDTDYLTIARDLKDIEYRALRGFAQDIKDGKLTEKQIHARARMYARSTRRSFEYGRSQTKQGQLARRKLGSCSPHCVECLLYATYGYVPISQLILPTERCSCKFNCCCSVEYSRDANILSDRLI